MNDFYTVKTGYTCNFDCIYCSVGNKRPVQDLTTKEIKNVIDTVPKGTGIILTGGETTIRPDFLDIAAYCKENNHQILLQTNGTMFADVVFAKEVLKQLKLIQLSFNSHDSSITDKIAQRSGVGEKAIIGFKNLVKMKFIVQTTTIVNKLNIDSLYHTFQFMYSFKKNLAMYITYPQFVGTCIQFKDLMVPLSECKENINKIMGSFKHAHLSNIPFCYAPPGKYNKTSYAITKSLSSKTIDLCSTNEIMNTYENLINQKCKGPKCKECLMDDKCPGMYKEYFDLFRNKLDLFPIKK
jgi:MoaA/NifB/PqqE/SkfB family radical SAM enzyme